VVSAGVSTGDQLRIDGRRPISAGSVEALLALCDRAEDEGGTGLTVVHVTGVPGDDWPGELNVGLVTKWERAVRRFERLPRCTVAVASGDCGGTALDVLLAAQFRIVSPGLRMRVPTDHDATWPGMALYRLARQATVGSIRRAALLGAPITADAALAVGLVDEVTDDVPAALAELAELAADTDGKELAIRRQLILDAARTSFEDALGSHLAACDRALRRSAET
jgi:isomerase DpgB